VYVVNPEGIARLRIVTIGRVLDSKVEILSGLSKGDRLVIEGREDVIDGAKVEER
jgi:multidrug efflux pump subunit AcrA (membrane-fusion protein)